jgi:hypothetical protein
VASLLRRLDPRHRRWTRLLAGLSLDPEVTPPRPIGPRDFLICGSPRTGTTLLTAELFQPPRVITVMEPWDGLRVEPSQLSASLRAELRETGRLRRGRLDVAALQATGEVAWCREGTPTPRLDIDADHLLGIKWPAFWRYLPLLPESKFVVCVRDPLGTVASFKGTPGRLRQGLDYDVPFHREMNEHLVTAADDERVRRALLYEYVNARIVPYVDRTNVFVVRYERWWSDREALLQGLSAFLGTELVPGGVALRPPESPSLPEEEAELVRRLCPSAVALGYAPGTGAHGS